MTTLPTAQRDLVRLSLAMRPPAAPAPAPVRVDHWSH